MKISGCGNYDYGFRIYNPSIGKFLSVDPLAEEYPELTPYQFASNRPIQGIDLDGLEFFIPTTLFSTSPVLSTSTATTLMSSSNGLRALPRTLYENGNKIEPIIYEPIKSPSGTPIDTILI
jgi:RHS repeat-associated protein